MPFFLVHAKDMPHDGSTPTYLEGYGGFQIANTPFFATSLYPWLEHGGAWVMANLRGGSEYGEEWHRHGMLHEKQHVFDDFFAVAEELAKQGIARADKLAIYGGSNGGLLMGAAITQRPELFAAVLCEAPLLDMVRYPQVGIGKAWIPEYGSPDQPEDSPGPARVLAVSPRDEGHEVSAAPHARRPTATTASTRCMRASSSPRCSGRRPEARCSCASRSTRGTAAPTS